MLHLDHNHTSTLSPHTKSTLILSNSPHPDQHALLSWSAQTHDDPYKYQEQLSAAHVKSDAVPPPPDVNANRDPSPSLGPNPGNAEDSKVPEPSPSSPPGPTSTESNSSLTPPPDSTSPVFPSTVLPAEESFGQSKVEDVEEQPKDGDMEEEDKGSRALTPLSELSSAPDMDESADGEKEDDDEDAAPGQTQDNIGAKSISESTIEPSKLGSESKAMNGHIDSPSAKPSATSVGPIARTSHESREPVPKSEINSDAAFQAQQIATPEPPIHTSFPVQSPQKFDSKVATILELNAELLRVCMELQTQGIPPNEQKFKEYYQRLQSNLTWLAAAADEGRKYSHQAPPFPMLNAPPPLEFVSTDRIQQLYSEMPLLFSKEMVRRQQLASNGALHPSGASPTDGHLKRERPDDTQTNISSKRRDTGESKTSTPTPATPSAVQPATPPHHMSAQSIMGPSGGSPSMPPPSVPPGMLPGGVDIQASMRARQMPMRQSMQPQQQQTLLHDGGRQMSPGSQQPGMPMQNIAGPSSSHQQSNQMAAMAALGPGGMQGLQILQNPAHPMVQYLTNSVPGFTSLPIQQQLQQLQKVQLWMHNRSQQQQQQQLQQQQQQARAVGPQAHLGNNMPGFSQGSVPSIQNGGMPSGHSTGSPNRLPGGQQHSPSQTNFPFSNHTPNPGMSNTTGMGNLTPAQQAAFANLDPHHRQLFLMQQQRHQQQQQMMRSGNPSTASMMNAQMFAAQQQRMAQQAGSSSHIGSPMLGGPNDGSFPALRSNPGVPGIARSTRTPSDHGASPMTPQLSQRGSVQMEDYQRAMMQQGQRGMTPNTPNPSSGQMGVGNINSAWPQGQSGTPHISHGQGSYGMSPPGSAGYGNMSGGVHSPAGNQWVHTGGQFPYAAASPAGSQHPSDGGAGPNSRQTSATPASNPHQQQMLQNSPSMGDQAGLSDLEFFNNWGQS